MFGWFRNPLLERARQSVPRTVEPFGELHVRELTFGELQAFQQAANEAQQGTAGMLVLYAGLACKGIDEFRRTRPHKLVRQLPPAKIFALGKAVLDVNGFTADAREDMAGNSAADPTTGSSAT